jgi:glutathione S-transferase
METSAELLYLLDYADKDNKFGFVDELEKSECIQWLFFWHGSGAPYQGNLGFFNRAAEKIPCTSSNEIRVLSLKYVADSLITLSCN